jgi:hypothetical protein
MCNGAHNERILLDKGGDQEGTHFRLVQLPLETGFSNSTAHSKAKADLVKGDSACDKCRFVLIVNIFTFITFLLVIITVVVALAIVVVIIVTLVFVLVLVLVVLVICVLWVVVFGRKPYADTS